MAFFVDEILLLDKTQTNVTSSSDLPVSITGTVVGDLTPWRVRLEMTNTGETGVDNSGNIKLRIDENKTFIKTGPLLLQEDAKTKYLIQAKITQTFSDGSQVVSKLFRFQLGTATVDVDERQGSMISLTLQEIQYAAREAFTSNELRFVTPREALNFRINDMNQTQPSGVTFAIGANNLLPTEPELEYVPQSPISVKTSVDEIFENLSQPEVIGGTFTDYYYDFDPVVNTTLTTQMKADEIGRENTGITLDPEAAEAIESDQEESTSTDLLRFKNQVMFRGSPSGGSLPREHSVYASQWEHAKRRSLYDSSRTIVDVYTNTKKYLKGETVKRTFTVGATGTPNVYPYLQLVKVTRFFKARTDIETSDSVTPEVSGNWIEDFVTIPKFDRTGHYKAGDIVYHQDSLSAAQPKIRFYQSNTDNFAWSLNRYREWNNGTNPYQQYTQTQTRNSVPLLNNSTGFLKLPTESNSNWTEITQVPAHAIGSTFVDCTGFSPWTSDVFDWEKNMVGLSGSLPRGVNCTPSNTGALTNNNSYVGLVPDWNLCKDNYDQQDPLDEFETISVKWIHSISNAPPSDSKLIYHGQRILVGTSGSGDFNNQDNRLAQYDKNKIADANGKWQFSALPVAGDTVVSLGTGYVYQHTGSAWIEAWRVEGNTDGRLQGDRANPTSTATPFHLVKDVYKTTGFEGTPNSAIEFRFLYDTQNLGIASSGDNKETKSFLARLNSRGAWLWFWFPFPRLGHSENGVVNQGDKYGGNGDSTGIGFTTLNTNNLSSDRKQSVKGWNNGLDSEDMGKINAISFKLKVGVFGSYVDAYNDAFFWELPDGTHGQSGTSQAEPELVVGLEKVPMTFWCVDMFDRIWYKTFTLRKNGRWDDVTIQMGDMSQANLYLPRWDELSTFLGIPLSATKFALKQREYSGIAFDWRFVRGWGIQYMAPYDDSGFYNGGVTGWQDNVEQGANMVAQGGYNLYAEAGKWMESVNANWWDVDPNSKLPTAYTIHRQATIAIDALHFKKELFVNSNDTQVTDARSTIKQGGGVNDYITAKALARGERERLSFFPQFWHIRAVGDVRMRIGKSFNVKGDRIPESPDLYQEWTASYTGNGYPINAKVKYNGFTYMSKTADNQGNTPTDTNDGYWENLNRLACGSVRHVIDHTGYHMEVVARRRFRL